MQDQQTAAKATTDESSAVDARRALEFVRQCIDTGRRNFEVVPQAGVRLIQSQAGTNRVVGMYR